MGRHFGFSGQIPLITRRSQVQILPPLYFRHLLGPPWRPYLFCLTLLTCVSLGSSVHSAVALVSTESRTPEKNRRYHPDPFEGPTIVARTNVLLPRLLREDAPCGRQPEGAAHDYQAALGRRGHSEQDAERYCRRSLGRWRIARLGGRRRRCCKDRSCAKAALSCIGVAACGILADS